MSITIGTFTPTSETIQSNQAITFVVQSTNPLVRVLVGVFYPGLNVEEFVYDGQPPAAGYKAPYAPTSSAQSVGGSGNNYFFSILRSPLWPDSPTVTVYAFDNAGTFYATSESWLVANPPVPSLPSLGASNVPAIVGGPLPFCPSTGHDQDYYLRLLQRCYPLEYWFGIKDAQNGGYELFEMFGKVGERLSLAISRTECGAFLMSATGGAYATGIILFSRTSTAAGAYTILAGTVVATADGRKFQTTESVSFGPTDLGPIAAPIQSLFQSYQYNVPGQVITAGGETIPGSISEIWAFSSTPQTIDPSLTVSQIEDTTGGVFPSLDGIGNDLGIPRLAGESDDIYRLRILSIPDTVSPDAICRGVIKMLAPLGYDWCCLREVGSTRFPGFFYDAGSSTDGGAPGIPPDPSHNFAYDMDFTIRPQDQFKLYFSLTEMRAFFLVGVPLLTASDFGLVYDGSVTDTVPRANPYDYVGNFGLGAYDGYAIVASAQYQSLWNMINSKRAGGVGFDFYIETNNCTF